MSDKTPREDQLDDMLDDSFPASDPPSTTPPSTTRRSKEQDEAHHADAAGMPHDDRHASETAGARQEGSTPPEADPG